jgi:hypothetical protein
MRQVTNDEAAQQGLGNAMVSGVATRWLQYYIVLLLPQQQQQQTSSSTAKWQVP